MSQHPAKPRLPKSRAGTRTVTDIEEPELERPETVRDGSVKGSVDRDLVMGPPEEVEEEDPK